MSKGNEFKSFIHAAVHKLSLTSVGGGGFPALHTGNRKIETLFSGSVVLTI